MDAKLKNDPQFRQGYLYAVRLLTASKKSEREIAKRLADKGYPLETVQDIVNELKTQKILSDQKLTQEMLQASLFEKRYGPKRIYYNLRKKGVSSLEAQKVVEAYPKSAEREAAEELAQARWKKLAKVESRKRKKRLFDFLINRGFNHELSREIIMKMAYEINENDRT